MVADALDQMGNHGVATKIRKRHPSSFTATKAEALASVQPLASLPTILKSDFPAVIVMNIETLHVQNIETLHLSTNSVTQTKFASCEGQSGVGIQARAFFDMEMVKIGDETSSTLELLASGTVLVKEMKEDFLLRFNLPHLLEDLGRLGNYIRLAYYGAVAAGHRNTTLQTMIHKIRCDVTRDCGKSAITVEKFKHTIGSNHQGICQSLLDGLVKKAIETLRFASSIACDMAVAAYQLSKEFDDLEVQLEAAQKEAKRMMDSEKPDEAKEALHSCIRGCRFLICVIMNVAHFWNEVKVYFDEVDKYSVRIEELITRGMRYEDEVKRFRLWTSKPFKHKIVRYNAGWVALVDVLTTYMTKMQETQKVLDSFRQENPTFSQSRIDIHTLKITLQKEFDRELTKMLERADRESEKEKRELVSEFEELCISN